MPELSPQDAEIYERLLDIIVRETNYDRRKLNMNTSIDDLGIIGMDCDCLLEAIAKEFEVDFSSFEFGRYCAPESLFDNTYDMRDPLLIEDLFWAAKNKVWTDRRPRKQKSAEDTRHERIGQAVLLAAASAYLGFLLKRFILK